MKLNCRDIPVVSLKDSNPQKFSFTIIIPQPTNHQLLSLATTKALLKLTPIYHQRLWANTHSFRNLTHTPNLVLPNICKCNQPGHRSSECPLTKTVNLVEGVDESEEGFEDANAKDFDDVEITGGDKDEKSKAFYKGSC